jgi:hypothetical protein
MILQMVGGGISISFLAHECLDFQQMLPDLIGLLFLVGCWKGLFKFADATFIHKVFIPAPD